MSLFPSCFLRDEVGLIGPLDLKGCLLALFFWLAAEFPWVFACAVLAHMGVWTCISIRAGAMVVIGIAILVFGLSTKSFSYGV